MTYLLQDMFISDCEYLVEQGFYDWCEQWSIDSPPPVWQPAPLQAKRDVALKGYKIYVSCAETSSVS